MLEEAYLTGVPIAAVVFVAANAVYMGVHWGGKRGKYQKTQYSYYDGSYKDIGFESVEWTGHLVGRVFISVFAALFWPITSLAAVGVGGGWLMGLYLDEKKRKEDAEKLAQQEMEKIFERIDSEIQRRLGNSPRVGGRDENLLNP